MAKPFAQPAVIGDRPRGTVEVTISVDASPAEVWKALTDPLIVAKWFGNLSSPFVEGQATRLDFDDGDFFGIETIRLDPLSTIQYSWRFLGIGPLDLITWKISPGESGCLVTVLDEEPGRTMEDALSLREGWLDFTSRLRRFLKSGKSSRYSWRRELDVSIELKADSKAAWPLLFETESLSDWLPVDAVAIESGAHLKLDDQADPSAFEITNARILAPSQIEFDLSSTDWLNPTRCALSIFPRTEGSLLGVSHNGWEEIKKGRAYQKGQRQRFCNFWIAALERAREIVKMKL